MKPIKHVVLAIISLLILISCSPQRFIFDGSRLKEGKAAYLGQIKHNLFINSQGEGALSKKDTHVNVFEYSDEEFMSPYEVSRIKLQPNMNYTVEVNSISATSFGMGNKIPVLHPLIKVMTQDGESLDVEVLDYSLGGRGVNTKWLIKSQDVAKTYNIVVFADRSRYSGSNAKVNQWVIFGSTSPLLFLPIQLKREILRVPYGKYKIKVINFDNSHRNPKLKTLQKVN